MPQSQSNSARSLNTGFEMDDLVEKWALRMALGNNGGGWATHYTEEQKEHWRTMAREWLQDASKGVRAIRQVEMEILRAAIGRRDWLAVEEAAHELRNAVDGLIAVMT